MGRGTTRAGSALLAIAGAVAPSGRAFADEAPERAYEVRPPAERVTLHLAADDNPPPPTEPRTVPPVEVHGPRPTPPAESPAFGPQPYLPEPFAGPTESAPFGPAGAPEWVSQRRWATTRAYVLPQGQVEAESWWKGKFARHGGDAEHLFQEEIAVGLPYRFQLDLYGNVEADEGHDAFYSGTQVEARWALADWGCLFGNPTLYGEWKFNTRGASDAWEAKALFADDICGAPCWHWGVNLFYEREIEGEEAIEMGASAAISRSVIDQRLAIGVEAQFERTSVRGARDDPENELLVGPSLQIRFNDDTHLDVVPLFGLTHDSPALEMYVVFGIALGGGSGSGAWGGPASGRSR